VVAPALVHSLVDRTAPTNVHVAHLNFEVFVELCEYSAYDSVVFGSFFSTLRNVTLGLSGPIAHLFNSQAGFIHNQ
jgi:hypothetical protein